MDISFKERIRIAFSTKGDKAKISPLQNSEDCKREEEESRTAVTEVAHPSKDRPEAHDHKSTDDGNYFPSAYYGTRGRSRQRGVPRTNLDRPEAYDHKSTDDGNCLPSAYYGTRGRSRQRGVPQANVSFVGLRGRNKHRGVPRHENVSDGGTINNQFDLNYDKWFQHDPHGTLTRRNNRGLPRNENHSSYRREYTSGPLHENASCYCCKANSKHLEKLRNENRYGDLKFNDFDGAGVNIFKNSSLSPQLLPYKIVEGNRVEYLRTPNHRPLEGFVADFLKPENRREVELTEEQKAALEPEEYWDI